jgi:hypothetical protein
MPFDIESLSGQHNVEQFDCGVDKVTIYLRRFALQNQMLRRSNAFVAVERGSGRILGYYTTSNAQVEYNHIPAQRGAPRYPVPCTLIGQLGADLTTRGSGERVGELLLFSALRNAMLADQHSASYAVITDASTPEAVTFFAKYGFERMEEAAQRPPLVRMYLPMETVRMMNL